MTRHVLITGGAGFIGSNLVRYVLRERPEWRITNLDALTYSGNPENLSGLDGEWRYRFVHGDITDAALVDGLMAECDAVLHLAAESHVDRSIMDSAPFMRSNVLGTQVLLDAARHAGVEKFVHVSTDEVYGSLPLESGEARFTEESPVAPNSPYAASKAASDLLVRAAVRTFGLPACITRCSNNFGPYQFPEKVIPLFVTNLIEGRTVPLYGDGRHVRDWIHVDDHCEALVAVLERGVVGEIYNVGADNERSNIELTRTILGLMDASESRIEHVTDRPGHDRRYAVDASKLRALGWSPSRSAWPATLADTVAWYRAHEAWWRRVKSGAYRASAGARS